MAQPLPYLKGSPSQTAGPSVHIGLAPSRAGFRACERELGWDVAGDAPGARIRVEGIVRDGTGAPVRDVPVESWQADDQGKVVVRIEAGPDACADCLVPLPVMQAIISDALADTPYSLDRIELPADTPGH